MARVKRKQQVGKGAMAHDPVLGDRRSRTSRLNSIPKRGFLIVTGAAARLLKTGKLDGRSQLGKAERSRLPALVSQLGGVDAMTPALLAVARNAIRLELLTEVAWAELDERLRNGQDPQRAQESFLRASSKMRDAYATLGLERRTKEVSLSDLLARPALEDKDKE
jgi:hypothetical protein